jgi:hypothetical protein
VARIAAAEIAAMLQNVKEEISWICSEKTTRVTPRILPSHRRRRKKKKEEEEEDKGEDGDEYA